jgi:hypothetical protein
MGNVNTATPIDTRFVIGNIKIAIVRVNVESPLVISFILFPFPSIVNLAGE